MRGLIKNFTGFLTKLLDHLFHHCSHFSVLSAHCLPAGIHSANYDPEISKCAWGTSKFFVFTHITSKPLLTQGFGGPTSGCVCNSPPVLEFAPSRDTPRSPRDSASAAHSRPRNSWQFFSVERLLPHESDVKSTHVFGRVTEHQNHTASLECPWQQLVQHQQKLGRKGMRNSLPPLDSCGLLLRYRLRQPLKSWLPVGCRVSNLMFYGALSIKIFGICSSVVTVPFQEHVLAAQKPQ